MSVFRLTPAAQRDLSAIWDYTEKHWSVEQAETYIGEIWAAIDRIADDPRRGTARDEVREGYSSYAVVSHVIFYKMGSEGIEIIRILHQRMEARNLQGNRHSIL